jgi:hypothetical protein
MKLVHHLPLQLLVALIEDEVPSIISAVKIKTWVRLKFVVAVEFAELVFGFCPSTSLTSRHDVNLIM